MNEKKSICWGFVSRATLKIFLRVVPVKVWFGHFKVSWNVCVTGIICKALCAPSQCGVV